MGNSKPISTPLPGHFKLSSQQHPISEKHKEEMKKVPYASTIGSLIYVMVYTRLNITHVVEVVSRFLSNPSKKYRHADKWILR